ncbi:MAG: sulfotransferase family protein [Myxococcota bacterium]
MGASEEFVFDVNVLMDRAHADTGLDDFGDERFKKGLSALCETLDTTAGLSESGRKMNWRRIVRLLGTRLRVEAAFKRHPEIRDRQIQSPIFLTGLPRSGTSATFNLLGCDPASRPLLLWEGTFPDPLEGLPPDAEDPRYKAMKDALAQMRDQNSDFAKIHYTDADTPEECVIPMAMTFENVHQGFEVLMEPYGSYFYGLDLHPQYADYREILKMIDWQRPGERWLLKSPAHLLGLDALLSAFPDSCVVLNHRDPVEAVASYCSMMETFSLSQGCSAQPGLGNAVLEFCATALERGLAVRDREDPGRFFDIRFDDFVEGPMQTVDRLYDHFGLSMTAEAEKVMQDHVANHPRGKHGSHEYDLASYGLDADQVRERLKWYIDRFDLGT